MSELHLGKIHARPYGWRADGIVEAEDRNINVTVRGPHSWAEDSDTTVVMANGWTAGKNSMRRPAREATKFGHTAITVEYTNTGLGSALDRNVQDIVDVVDATVSDRYSIAQNSRRAVMGLSMGGAVMTMALGRTKTPIETANIVAPGKYILPEYYSIREVSRRVIAEGLELSSIGRRPADALSIGATSAANCLRRRAAVVGEIIELLRGTVHDDLIAAKSSPNPPYVRFTYMLNDKLLPAFAQHASIQGLPFDDVRAYSGEHGRLAYDPLLAHDIFAADKARLNSGDHQSLAA